MEEYDSKPLKAYVFSCPGCGSPMKYFFLYALISPPCFSA